MLHLLIEKKVVKVGAEKIDVERDARYDPKKHELIGEEVSKPHPTPNIIAHQVTTDIQ